MSLANTIITTGWGSQPLARVIRIERRLGQGSFGFDPVAKRVHNATIRGFIRQAREIAHAG